MKKIVGALLILAATIQLYAQTEGISYQAVIIGPDGQEIPGIDAEGNILPDAGVAIRFTILDQNNSQVYQEIQMTHTDMYGRVNLVIGSEDLDGFSEVNWDGTSKSLKVEIDFGGSGSEFVDMSRQELNFVPYSFHRDIIARGTLVVDDVTDLNGELRVAGPTNLNSSFTVNDGNTTNLTGLLSVSGAVNLDSSLMVVGNASLNNALTVDSAVLFSNNLTVGGLAQFDGDTKFDNLNVDGNSTLTGQVTINADIADQGDSSYASYPLRVEGSYQGIAVKVNGSRSISNNYVTFWDSTGIQGRIEGETIGDLTKNPEWISETAIRGADVVANTIEIVSLIIEIVLDWSEVAAEATDARVVIPIGVTVPSPVKTSVKVAIAVKHIADVAAWLINEGMAIAEAVTFEVFSLGQAGVTYQSKGADYAEWIAKENPADQFIPGELVGIRNGYASKKVFGADKVMVVSTNPVVVGNMPPDLDESKFVKIAFMGQVPVRVLGEVQTGDYILPYELNSGLAKAVIPDEMKTRDYKKIVGVAWETFNTSAEGINIVNVAVGLNTNDLADIVADLEDEVDQLRLEFNDLKSHIFSPQSLGQKDNVTSKGEISDPAVQVEQGIPIIEFSREDVEEGIEIAWKQYLDMLNNTTSIDRIPGIKDIKSANSKGLESIKTMDFAKGPLLPADEHPFWSRMNTEPDYKEEIIQYIRSEVEMVMKKHEENGQKSYEVKFINF